jgi:hypothetical protein
MTEGPKNQELEINLATFLKVIWSRKLILAFLLVLAACGGAAWFKFQKKTYVSSVTFVQSKGDVDLSAMQGLGALSMLGMGGATSEPPLLKYLEKYIKTREFLLSLRDSMYRDTSVIRKLLGPGADLPNAQLAYLGKIAPLLKVTRDNGMVTIKASHTDSLFSFFLVNTVYSTFSRDFSQERRNLLRDNLVFVRELVEKTQEESQKAAAALRVFMEQNREMGAPIIEEKRHAIMLRVKMAEEKYVQSEKEKALLEIKNERKDESLVIIEKAFIPDSPASPVLALCLAVPIVLALVLGIIAIGIADRRKWITVQTR